jgi:predicted amidohydrolase
MPAVRVAVAQTAPVVGDVAANLADAERHIAALAGRADLVVFPELFTTGYRLAGLDHAYLADPLPGGPSIARLSRAAAAAKLAVSGTLLESAGPALYDTAILIGPDGALVGCYRKSHLYPAERAYFAPGQELTVLSLGADLRVGMAICFEHAFPEIFTELALSGANLVAIPSAVPVGYEHLLELRTRARAQDNQLFVAAANLVGDDGQSRWCGGSLIIDPRGDVLAAAGSDGPAVIVATVELDRIAAERASEPALVNRRPELYPHLLPRS